MSKSKRDSNHAGLRRMLFQGWLGLAFWMSFGFLLESLMAYKAPSYLADLQRRELFRMAHAHGSLLSLLLIIVSLCVRFELIAPSRAAEFGLRAGSVLLPIGFMLSGIWHPEGDPGSGIWLVPIGAVMLIFGVVGCAISARRFKG